VGGGACWAGGTTGDFTSGVGVGARGPCAVFGLSGWLLPAFFWSADAPPLNTSTAMVTTIAATRAATPIASARRRR